MRNKKRSTALDYHVKNFNKKIKTVVQSVVLFVLAVLVFLAVFDIKKYEEPDKAQWDNRQGFIAVSYFGVGLSGTPRLIAKNQLRQHLKALHNQGYRTISQQDILNFYNSRQALPEKALFLSFEDGRNDSSLFAQPILEKYNYKATILSYANKLGNTRESKFLQPKELLKMIKNGYWELGSNGYRLTYINIFDKNNAFIGVKDEAEFQDKDSAASYNHYLMDFIRDEDKVPSENRTEMEARVNGDYAMMRDIYTQKLGFVPPVYMIMHANSLNDGMPRLVADVNNRNIQDMFKIHFNRDKNAFNDSEQNLYDLTRVQAAPYWYTNHLLMKIGKDTGELMKFVVGNRKNAGKWALMDGAAEFIDNKIVLTSPSSDNGLLYLKDSDAYTDMKLSAKLSGNVVGKQSVYVRYDTRQDSFLRVSLLNNEIIVEQKTPGNQVETLFSQELNALEGQTEEGTYPINIQQTRNLEMVVKGNQFTLRVDKAVWMENSPIADSLTAGGVALESAYSEMNPKDDIYDGVFADIKIESIDQAGGKEALLYNNGYNAFQWTVSKVREMINSTINRAIELF